MMLKKISLKNIRSYEDAEIFFPEGSTVLAGDIGTGKTSVLLAIEFALFGLQPGQKGSALLRNNKDEGSVLLEIEIEGKKIIIERGLKRGKTVNQTTATIEISGEKKEFSVTELKNKVLEILNYPREFAKKTNLLYRFTVYTPQEEMKQIILETSETRLTTLRHVFGIDKYKRIRENTETFTAKLRERVREYKGEIADLEEIKKKLEEKKKEAQNLDEKIKVSVIELEKRKKARIKTENELKETEKKIEEKEKYEQEAEKTKVMLVGKKELILGIEKERFQLEKQLDEAKKIKFSTEELKETEKTRQENEKESEIKSKEYLELLSKIKSLNSKISDSEKLKSQISVLRLCPTCLQDVDETYKKNIVRKLEEDIIKNNKEMEKLELNKNQLSTEIENLKKEMLNLNKKIEEFNMLRIKLESTKEKENKIYDLEKQKASAQKDINLLEGQVLRLKEASFALKKYENIYVQKEKELQDLREKERENEIELASIKKEKELTLKRVQEIEKEIEKKEKIKAKLIKTAELEDWLSSSFLNIISFTERNIMLKLKEEFSKLFNEWFNVLVPEIFSVRLDEDFTPIIEQQDYSLDYSFLSGGERTAIALAYRLALNQLLNSLLSKIKTKDLVILDEPTDGFSEQQLDKIRDVLNELKVKQLIIVSHESKIESFVENIIKFRKEAGVTRVEV